MSKASRFKKDRLFQYINKFTYSGNDYLESLYYLIKNVERDEKSKITKIEVTFIIDIQRYLNLGEYNTIEKTFENDIPQDFINNANAYEELK
ncbi:hypothetical protein [Flavobacterium yafengii]|uniref:Uncharacterized protein n=1 Tax=Flavobacterium yafengii TaxID=3041253 RepID=A0AAW6TIL4_9FLAO|nr:hypothetical protein [Flavobacterium yafengii]MDI5949467.1 hypothetical protein [Flavobacterium yafengii]